MEFDLSDDQRMFQESVKNYLEAACPLDRVRQCADGDGAVSSDLTRGITELGAAQIMIPEEYGGLGLGLLDAVLVQEMLGRSVAPADFMGTAAMAVVGILSAGTEEQKAEWLPKIASGAVRFGIALAEHVGARENAGVRSEDGRLNGRSLFVMDMRNATHLLVCDTQGRLHIVEPGVPGLGGTDLTTIDRTRHFTELTFDGVPATALAGENERGRGADRMVQTGRMMLAADTLGAAQAMLEKAVAYSLEREQFGRVIGSFMAVKHLCSEMAADLEPARALVWHAAHAIDQDMDEAELMACLAKAHLAEVGTFVARTSVEVHGGMGFTDLVGLHYWFKRIGANRQLLGSPEQVRLEAAKIQGWA